MYGLVDGVFPCGRGFEEKPDPAEQASDGAGWESRDAGHTKGNWLGCAGYPFARFILGLQQGDSQIPALLG